MYFYIDKVKSTLPKSKEKYTKNMYVLVNLRNKIIPILKKRDWSIELFAEKCSLTKAGFLNILNNNDTKISTLITICNVLEISVDSLFDDVSTDEPKNIVKEQRTEYLTIPDKYAQCLENNNLLLTELRQCKQELEAIKKQGGKVKITTK